jgi:hypothetical protein
MNKTVIKSILTLLVLISLVSTIGQTVEGRFPTILAGGLAGIYRCESQLRLEYDSDAAEDQFLPIDRVKKIPIEIGYQISGQYAQMLAEYYTTKDIVSFIYLYIEDTPEWCVASISPPLVKIYPNASWATENASIEIKVNENAPASTQGVLKVRMDARRVGTIQSGTFTAEIPFIPGYLPVLDIEADRKKQLIGPYDTAYFNIDIENLGNAKTTLVCDVIDPPQNWIVTIGSDIVIGATTSNDDPKKTIQLSIKPPLNFGYHNDREVINISITPTYFNDPTIKGEQYYVSFIVQSQGFSTPGLEPGLIFSIIMFIFILMRHNKLKGEKKK